MGDAGSEPVARRMGISVNGLRRQLRDCNWPFDELVSSVRHAVALRYLAKPDYGVMDIALMLGYSELSAFSRAFRRLQGVSPSTYRRAGCRISQS